jgi:hypothetical protein
LWRQEKRDHIWIITEFVPPTTRKNSQGTMHVVQKISRSVKRCPMLLIEPFGLLLIANGGPNGNRAQGRRNRDHAPTA